MPLERGLNVMLLQVLPDDPRDNAHGYATLHVQAGDGKGYIILFPGHPVVIAGVGHRIDAVGKPDCWSRPELAANRRREMTSCRGELSCQPS